MVRALVIKPRFKGSIEGCAIYYFNEFVLRDIDIMSIIEREYV